MNRLYRISLMLGLMAVGACSAGERVDDDDVARRHARERMLVEAEFATYELTGVGYGGPEISRRVEWIKATWHARVEGEADAYRDFRSGALQLKVPAEPNDLERAYLERLEQELDLGSDPIEGPLTPNDIAYIYGYNAQAEQLLVRVHGRPRFRQLLSEAIRDAQVVTWAVRSPFFLPRLYETSTAQDGLHHAMEGFKER